MSNKIQNLFDIKRTQIELVRDRGYIVPDGEQELLNGTLENFTNYLQELRRLYPNFTDRVRLRQSYVNAAGKQMAVFFVARTEPTQKQIPAELITTIVSQTIAYRFDELIIIIDALLSPKGNETLETLTGTKWQVFFDSDLTYNPTLSVDVPHHELLSAETVSAKLAEWKIDISKLLIYESSDPIVKYYGWSTGSVVRVIRKDNSVNTLSAESINYRVVNK